MGGIHIIKLLIGGSPCTHWSKAQTKNREVKAEGLGWGLFLNYRLARDKYQPDYFVYENNKSMSPAIRAQITEELGVEPVLINSALVSAQTRWRLYWVGKRNPDGTYSQVAVEQPLDRGILLRDVLEDTMAEKGYALKPLSEREMDYMVGEHGKYSDRWTYLLKPGELEKACCVTANICKGVSYNVCATPLRVGTIENDAKNQTFDSQQYRVYSPDAKSVTLCGNGGGLGAKTGLYAVPVAGRVVGRRINEQGRRDDYNEEIERIQRFEVNEDPNKTNCLSTVAKDNMIAVPVYCGKHGEMTMCTPDGKEIPVYRVSGGFITVKGREHPIKLADGYYIIRKLTVTECRRLQTVPDSYVFPVSDSQSYKMLGNGWTVDVIAHILSHLDGLTTEPVEVLSMYDGMSCGHIALDKLGADVAAYYATEIDKYAIQTTQHNYPGTIQLGDAFQVREPDWALPQKGVL